MKISEIKGHENQIRFLEGIMERNVLPHALLFTGPSGTGKRTIGLALLKAHLCGKEGSPRERNLWEAGAHPDQIILEPGENGRIPIGSMEQPEPGSVRWLIHRLSLASGSGRRAVLINGIETLTTAGQNALLKTVEEPPLGTVMVLVTSRRTGVLPTIRSRCMELSFNSIPAELLESILIERGVDRERARKVSMISAGSVELALILSDEKTLMELFHLSGELSRSLREGAFPEIEITSLTRKTGSGGLILILTEVYRHMLLARYGRQTSIFPEESSIQDIDSLRFMIKNLLALHRGLENNLTITTMLKAALYGNRRVPLPGIPGPAELVTVE